jgi:hypothetical protein
MKSKIDLSFLPEIKNKNLQSNKIILKELSPGKYEYL